VITDQVWMNTMVFQMTINAMIVITTVLPIGDGDAPKGNSVFAIA
jgi:hypothetical protein